MLPSEFDRDELPLGTADYVPIRDGFYARHYTGISMVLFPGREDFTISVPGSIGEVSKAKFALFLFWLEDILKHAQIDASIEVDVLKQAIEHSYGQKIFS